MPSRESMHHLGNVFITSSPCLRGTQRVTSVTCSPHPVHASRGVNASHSQSVHHILSIHPRESTRHLGNVFTTSSPCLRGSQCITLVKCSPHRVHAFPGVYASHW